MPWLRLHITNLCNFACPGCHVFKIGDNKIPETNMSYEVAEKAVRFFIGLIRNYFPNGPYFRLSIYGGEPLLNRPVIYRLLEEIGRENQSVNIEWILNTNGSLLNQEDLSHFSSVEVDIHMSIDGLEEKHNRTRKDKLGKKTFDRVMNAVDLIKDNRYPYLQFDSVADPFLPSTMLEVLEAAKKKGVSRIHFDPYYSPDYPVDFSQNVYALQYAEAFRWGKEMGINVFSTPLNQIYSNFINKRESVQNRVSIFPSIEVFADGSFIFNELPLIKPFDFLPNLGQDEIWNRRTNALLCSEKEIQSTCRDCYLKPFCSGDVKRVYRYHTNTTKNEENICEVIRQTVLNLYQNKYIPLDYVKG